MWFGFTLCRQGFALSWPPSIKLLVNPIVHVRSRLEDKLHLKIGPKSLILRMLTVAISRIPCTIKTDTQGCGVGLADTMLIAQLLTTHSEIQKPKYSSVLIIIDHSDSLSLSNTVHLHTSHASHLFTLTTLSHYNIGLGNSKNHWSSLSLCFASFS